MDVRIREACEDCDGTGAQRVEAGAGHVRWTKKACCPACNGTGERERWIALAEFRQCLAEDDEAASS